MFLAGTAQDKRRGDDGSAKPKSHNALAQLSASCIQRKMKAQKL
jgi:hypothetical protein